VVAIRGELLDLLQRLVARRRLDCPRVFQQDVRASAVD
jgi:hypothetical protein